ncbi:MAG TPA: hypothetical protein VKB93_12325 [Thermoanaerobaculia bacterium]|nr:hypothetical protein [Thermoanaerobaculia bacterium]
MSTARLNVWVTKVGDPCRIDNDHQWYVHILHCDGTPLVWCGRKYLNLPTKCSHLETQIPPGCYMICATWSPAPVNGGPITTLGNHISHLQIIRAECAKEICVTLFPPTFHWCGIWWLVAARELAANKAVKGDLAERAIGAVEALLKEVPQDTLTKNMLEIQQRAGERPKGPPPDEKQ